MPLQRRVPKFGFKNPNRRVYRTLNLSQLCALIEAGRLDAEQPITVAALVAIGQARAKERIKILGDGELETPLRVEAHAFSRAATQKIVAAGGSTTVVKNN